METLRIAPGLVAVYAARLIMVCAVKPAGRVAVRDLGSGEVSEIAVGELSARAPPPAMVSRESDATRLHADVVRASPARYRTAQRREQLVVAALVREGPLKLAVEQTSAVSGVGPRSLWRWTARYRAWLATAALLLEKRGVAPKARRLSAETEGEINAAVDAIFLTQPRGTYEAVCEEVWRRCDAAQLRRPSRKHSARQIAEVLERIAFLRELCIDRHWGDLSDVLVRRYARRMAARAPSISARVKEPGRTIRGLLPALLPARRKVKVRPRFRHFSVWRRLAGLTFALELSEAKVLLRLCAKQIRNFTDAMRRDRA